MFSKKHCCSLLVCVFNTLQKIKMEAPLTEPVQICYGAKRGQTFFRRGWEDSQKVNSYFDHFYSFFFINYHVLGGCFQDQHFKNWEKQSKIEIKSTMLLQIIFLIDHFQLMWAANSDFASLSQRIITVCHPHRLEMIN